MKKVILALSLFASAPAFANLILFTGETYQGVSCVDASQRKTVTCSCENDGLYGNYGSAGSVTFNVLRSTSRAQILQTGSEVCGQEYSLTYPKATDCR